MRRNVFTWTICLIAELLLILGGLVVIDILIVKQANKIRAEISTLRADIEAQGEFIAKLQMEIEDTNAQASWLFNKIDQRRVLIPVMGGRAYKLVEIQNETRTEPPDRKLPGE